SFGWFNHLLGISGTEWLSDPSRALYVLAAVDIWQWTPFMFIIILSGLQGISTEVIEAARVDGASLMQLFTRIIWPLMLPISSVAIVLRAIDGFKVFDLVFTLTYGGPGTSTESLSFFLYRLGFISRDYGLAAAASVLLSLVVGVLVTIY